MATNLSISKTKTEVSSKNNTITVTNNNTGNTVNVKGEITSVVEIATRGLNGVDGINGIDGIDGVDAISAELTREGHILPLSSSGDIISFAGANTTMKVFEGQTDKTSNYTFTRTSDSHITTTISSNTVTVLDISLL